MCYGFFTIYSSIFHIETVSGRMMHINIMFEPLQPDTILQRLAHMHIDNKSCWFGIGQI